MRQSVISLESFYAARLGQAATSMVSRRLASVWPTLKGRDVLGFGYTYPYLKPYLDDTRRTVLAMPGGQGAIAQSRSSGMITCLTCSTQLPFEDAQFDYILVAHGVEEAVHLPEMMRELWRVTRPEGRIVIIAANRAGLWARSEKSPFGAGRPFSKSQLKGLLSDAGFVPILWSGALYIPPVRHIAGEPFLSLTERFGETVWPGFSGLVLVEAVKRLYANIEGQKAIGVERPVFGTRPVGTTATRH